MTESISTPVQYWINMVGMDLVDFSNNEDDLRRAFHCAISLYHMHDWIFVAHKQQVMALFDVTDERQFSEKLRKQHKSFELIARIANSGKHLALRSSGPAPTNAANTQVQSTGYGVGGYGAGAYGGTRRVVLEGTGEEVYYLVEKVRQMWVYLSKEHNWGLHPPPLLVGKFPSGNI